MNLKVPKSEIEEGELFKMNIFMKESVVNSTNALELIDRKQPEKAVSTVSNRL